MYGKNWYFDRKGNIKMNYGGYQEPKWEPWQQKFCWLPKKIIITVAFDDSPYRNSYNMTKWVWFKTIFVRKRIKMHYPETTYEYEYAEDLFDLMRQDTL